MKVGSLCVIFFYVGWTLCFDYAQATGTCGLLSPPSNGAIASCTRGNRSGSRCRVRCLTGFTPMQVSRVCNCLGELCRWNGRNPTCEPLECRKPDIDDGRITIVEEWATGFASLVEFPYIPSNVSEGWAILIAFDRPLGNNAFLSSWSSQPTSVSPSHNAFTLNNLPYNSNLGSLNSHYRTLVVIQGVEGEKPQRGYVGLFNGRLTDATCHTPSRLSDLETLPAYTTTTPAPTTTVATTTTETPARLTTQPAATTPDVTTTSTAETTAAVTTTTEVPTTTPATTTTPTRTTTTTTTATTTTTTTRATTTAAPSNSVQFQGKSCRIQRIGAYRTEATGWVDNGTSFFSGKLKYNVPAAVSDWLLVIVFQQRVKHMQVWSARVAGSMRNGYVWKLSALSWNAVLYPGELQMNFIAGLWQQTNDYPSGRVYLCSSEYNTGDAVDLFPNSNHANDVEEEAEEEEEEEEEEGEEETSGMYQFSVLTWKTKPHCKLQYSLRGGI